MFFKNIFQFFLENVFFLLTASLKVVFSFEFVTMVIGVYEYHFFLLVYAEFTMVS